MNSKPPIAPIAQAAENLLAALEDLGLGTRVERSNASNASVYVYAFTGQEPGELKIRVSNHTAKKAAFYHRAPDFELLVPGGRVSHIVEQVKSRLRAIVPTMEQN